MAGIKDYSTTQANNTSLNSISTAEGMLPSNLNNAIRALMKNTRDWYNDSQWVEYGDGSGAYTATYASATSFTIDGVDVTSFYHAGRRIKLTASTPGTIYGTIASSSFSTNTTVNVTWDSGSLSNEAISNVYVAALSKTNSSIPTEIIGTSNISDGAVTLAKMATDSVNGDKIADDSINSEHYVDGSIDTAHIADSQITLAKLSGDSVDSSKIVNDSIVNADINSSAAIDATKIHDGTISNTEFGYLNGVSSAIQTQINSKINTSEIGSSVQAYDTELAAIAGLTSAADKGIQFTGSGTAGTFDLTTAGKALLDDADASTQRSTLGLGTIATQNSNNVTVTGGSITGLGSPSATSDAATKNYVDQAVAGLRTRTIAECASTANVNLSNGLEAGDSIDGVTLVAGDRVLLKDQTDATENGLYLAVSSGAASRDPEHDTIAELSGGMVVVNQGTSNDNKIFLCTTDSDGVIGSTNITYTIVTPQNVGTVTSVGVADAGSSEFTITNSPVTSSGTINLAVNSISATKIGNGNVDNTELSYVNGVTSAIQTQIDTKASNGFAIAMSIAL
jgi:hypothetical protein